MLDGATSLTLGATLRKVAALHPERVALVSHQRELTWGELDAEVDSLSSLLIELGVKPGDVVGFMISKRPEVVTGFLACARIGAVHSVIFGGFSPEAIATGIYQPPQ